MAGGGGWSEGMGPWVGPRADGAPPSLLAVVNSSGGAGSGLGFGGTMGSNALSFYSGGGPGVLKAYSIGTTSANRRSTRN